MDDNEVERNHWGSPTEATTRDAVSNGSLASQGTSATHFFDKNGGPSTSKATRKGNEDALDSEDSDDDEEAGLDPEGRRQKRETRARATSLDGRVSGEILTAKEERKLADMEVLKRLAVNAILIALWYTFSISISVYNKWMFSPDNLDFKFPLFTTSMHMVVQFVLSSAALYFFPRFRPSHAVVEEEEHHKPDEQEVNVRSKKPIMTPWFYISRIGPCGTATGLDIGLGNMSLKFITLTFFTMCKSSALAFVLLWAFIFKLETPSLKLILIILTMTAGVVMMVAGETFFNLLGFILIILSAFFSGFRWALTQILLLRNPATSNPFSTLFFLTPVTFLAMFLLAIPIEGFGPLGSGFSRLAAAKGTGVGILLILFPGMIAFCMMSAEYALLKRTSVVTLSICGIFKEVLTITASQYVYHDPLTPINISGLIVTIGSIAAYNYVKVNKMRKDARNEVHGHVVEHAAREETMQMLDAVEEEEGEGVDEEDVAVRVRRSLGLDREGEGEGSSAGGR